MNDSTENSLRQFENLEKEITVTPASSTNFTPLRVPTFKQVDLIPPPNRASPFGAFAGNGANNNNVNRPLFHSTPQERTGGIGIGSTTTAGRGAPTAKRSQNLYTPGGRPVSPIAEECGEGNGGGRGTEDLDRLVSDVRKLQEQQGGDKIVQSLVTQLRDLIAQWDWAQARHRHVAKIYFERQQDELNAGWEKLQSEMAKFNEQRNDDYARIANIRSGLQSDRAKASSKKDAERIKELELEVEKLKAKELLSSQKLSELRTKIRELEGEVRVREQSYTEHMIKIRKGEQQLVRAEQENSNLRTKLTLIRAEQRQQQEQQSQQNALQNNNSNKQQSQKQPGPRATLFGIPASRISSTSSSGGAGSSSSSSAPFIRQNNSDSVFGQPQQPIAGNTTRMHRSFSENGNGWSNAQSNTLRPRVVRFAEDQSHQQISSTDSMPFSNPTSPQLGAGAEMSTMLNKRFDIPAGMMNTMYRMTKRGREFTFTSDDGNGEEGAQQSHQPVAIVVTELLGCQSAPFCRHCLLYEYPQQQSDGGFKDFRWISGPLIQMPFGPGTRNDHGRQQQRGIQIEYHHADGLYKVRTHLGHIVRFLLTGQLEIRWANGDRTMILPDGERREDFCPAQHDSRMEIYLPTGIAFRLGASTQWQSEQFVPDTQRMSMRPDGSYSMVIVERLHDRNDADGQGILSGDQLASLQINGPGFQLRRFNATRAIKIALHEPGVPGGSLQLWLCIDNVLLVKHAQQFNDGTAANDAGASTERKKKHICFTHGQCEHFPETIHRN